MPRRLSKSSTDGSKFSGSARQTTLTTSYTGPKGDKGDTGAAGADADTPNWTLQTSTVAAGGTPTVSATGTYPNQTITFGLVTGSAGADGVDGVDGTNGTNGSDGTGFTGGSYNSSNGTVTFTSDDGLGFTTGDLRGADGADGADGSDGSDGTNGTNGTNGSDGTGFTGGSYNSSNGTVTFTSDDGLGFTTGDLRGADGADGADSTVAGPTGPAGADGTGFTGGSYNSSNGTVTFTSDDGLGFSTGDLRASSVPSGGSTSQVLAKASNTDGDATWVDNTGGHAIKDEGGSALTTRANMTFIGELVEASDNSSTTSTDITMDAKTVWLYA